MSSNLDNAVKLNEVLCEFLEVIVHNILFIRKLYPESIFVRKSKYGVVVYQSVHPQLNEYIRDSLRAVDFHLKTQQLKKFVVCLCCNDSTVEKYVIDILDLQQKLDDIHFYDKLTSSLRAFCLKLHTKGSSLEILSDASFHIQLHTTELSKNDFDINPIFEDFPWMLTNGKDTEIPQADIIPLSSVDTEALKLQFYIEKCCKNK